MGKISRIKFYADVGNVKNKYFCYNIRSILDLESRLGYFVRKGYNIRAAWYEEIDGETNEIICNNRIDLLSVYDNLREKYKK